MSIRVKLMCSTQSRVPTDIFVYRSHHALFAVQAFASCWSITGMDEFALGLLNLHQAAQLSQIDMPPAMFHSFSQ